MFLPAGSVGIRRETWVENQVQTASKKDVMTQLSDGLRQQNVMLVMKGDMRVLLLIWQIQQAVQLISSSGTISAIMEGCVYEEITTLSQDSSNFQTKKWCHKPKCGLATTGLLLSLRGSNNSVLHFCLDTSVPFLIVHRTLRFYWVNCTCPCVSPADFPASNFKASPKSAMQAVRLLFNSTFLLLISLKYKKEQK